MPTVQAVRHIAEESDSTEALGDATPADYAFCQRARTCGFRIVADTSIRLWHIGSYAFGWEDAGMERERIATFTLHFPPPGRPQ